MADWSPDAPPCGWEGPERDGTPIDRCPTCMPNSSSDRPPCRRKSALRLCGIGTNQCRRIVAPPASFRFCDVRASCSWCQTAACRLDRFWCVKRTPCRLDAPALPGSSGHAAPFYHTYTVHGEHSERYDVCTAIFQGGRRPSCFCRSLPPPSLSLIPHRHSPCLFAPSQLLP